MAKKTSQKKKDLVEDIIDAEEIKVDEDSAKEVVETDIETQAASPDELADDAEIDEMAEPEEIDTSDVNDTSDKVVEEPEEKSSHSSADRSAKQPVFLPLFLGGLLAGGVGFGAATYLNGQADDDMSSQIAALNAQLEELSGREEVDLAPLSGSLLEVESAVDQFQTSLDAAVSDLSARIDVIERQPSGDGTLQEAAVAAYERDIQALRDQLNAQQAEMQGMLDATTQQLAETQQEAAAIEEQTVAAAKAATARSALARIQSALDAGSPFGAVLAELEAVSSEPIPPALTNVQDGAPTLAVLTSEFPESARAALATARSEGASGETTSGFSAFLRNQFSVRSVVPQEGDSVDAILSRAQSALSEGRLNEALSEVASLPEVARVELSDWVAQAELRADAVDAAATLFTSYNTN